MTVESLTPAIARRGPDHLGSCEVAPLAIGTGPSLHFVAAVLHIQGDDMCRQPVSDDQGNVFLWNGEVFGATANSFFDAPRPGSSDTSVIAAVLHKLAPMNRDEMAVALGHVHGPFAFIYFHRRTSTLYFGKDPFGRRSLLQLRNTDDGTISALSSVSTIDDLCPGWRWEEVGIEGIQAISFNDDGSQHEALLPWSPSRIRLGRTSFNTDSESTYESTVAHFLHVCQNAVAKRVARLSQHSSRGTGNVGVLFSGGLDSAFLAALLHHCMKNPEDSIDLINVSFEMDNSILSPDRKASLEALSELQTLFPTRNWRLICANIDESERVAKREKIVQLIHPSTTVMDLNIGTAFYFAARAKGFVGDEPVESDCRVLIVGIGADEQMAGYGRHRARGDNVISLQSEMNVDLERLWKRNLSRDCRCVSDAGKEVWLPFLDEDVVGFLQSIPVGQIADFKGAPGFGDKKILRDAARLLGFASTADRIKRAVQFGTHIAKATNRDQKMSNRKGRGDTNFQR